MLWRLWEPGGSFTNVSQALQNNLMKIYNTRNNIYVENFKLKLCTCVQSMALGIRTKFQLEIFARSTISAIDKFWENILESSRNVMIDSYIIPENWSLTTLYLWGNVFLSMVAGLAPRFTFPNLSSKLMSSWHKTDNIPKQPYKIGNIILMALTHWTRVTHLCISKLTIIGSDNGLSPGRSQAIIWTNVGILLIGPLGTNFSEISIDIYTFSFKKEHLKMSSGKWRPFCLGLNVLTGATKQAPYHVVKSLQAIWKSGCSDVIKWEGTRSVGPRMAAKQHCSIQCWFLTNMKFCLCHLNTFSMKIRGHVYNKFTCVSINVI